MDAAFQQAIINDRDETEKSVMKSELSDMLISMLVDGNEIVSLFCTYMDEFIYTEFDECERHFSRFCYKCVRLF